MSFVIDDFLLFCALSPLRGQKQIGAAFTELEIMTFSKIASEGGKWTADVRLWGQLQTSTHSRWHAAATSRNNTSPRTRCLCAGCSLNEHCLFAFNFICLMNHHRHVTDADQLGRGQACPLEARSFHHHYLSLLPNPALLSSDVCSHSAQDPHQRSRRSSSQLTGLFDIRFL